MLRHRRCSTPKRVERRPVERRHAHPLRLVEETARSAEEDDAGSFLRPITGVDADVAFGEVAGPKAGFGLTRAADFEFDVDVRFFELGFENGFVEINGEAGLADRHPLKQNVHFAWIELRARVQQLRARIATWVGG